jgi:hypothetical protein
MKTSPKLSLGTLGPDIQPAPVTILATCAICVAVLVIVLTVICFVFWKTPKMLSPIITPPAAITVMAMFKNEAHVLREWLQHYAEQGITHAVLIDNGSTDDYRESIQDFVDSGFVTLVQEPQRHVQVKSYNYNFEQHIRGKAEWLLVCDMDEFVFGAKRVPLALELLEVPDDVGVIFFRWIMFGSNGHVKQPPSVVKGFTRRLKYPDSTPNFSESKYLVRADSVAPGGLGIHTVRLKSESESPKAARRVVRLGEHRTEASLQLEPIRIHHYAIQSWDWFRTVKMTRGDVNAKESDTVRNAAYFKLYDRNDLEDKTLAP